MPHQCFIFQGCAGMCERITKWPSFTLCRRRKSKGCLGSGMSLVHFFYIQTNTTAIMTSVNAPHLMPSHPWKLSALGHMSRGTDALEDLMKTNRNWKRKTERKKEDTEWEKADRDTFLSSPCVWLALLSCSYAQLSFHLGVWIGTDSLRHRHERNTDAAACVP